MRRGPRFVATLAAIALVSVLAALDQTVVATALPHMIAELHGAAILGWVFTAYFLSATATVAVAGKLADLFGRRGVFMVSVAIFLAGSLLSGLADSMLWLVVFRAVQGVGAGSINTLSFIVMGDLFSARERGKWQAVNNIGFATASAIGPSIGGLLSDNVSWRWIFLVNVPLCLATLVALWYGLSQPPHGKARPAIDWAGATLSIVGVVAILLALTWGGREYAWTSPEVISLLVVTAIVTVLLWRVERRASDPLIPPGILSGGVVPYVCVAHFATFFVWFTMILIAPLRLQLVLGASATTAGALLTPGIVLSPFSAFFAGQIVSRTGRCRLMCRLGAVLQVLGLAMLLYVPEALPEVWVLASFAVVGMGTGFAAPSMTIAFQNAIPRLRLGAGMGLLSLFRQFGSSVGTALVGAIVGASVAVVASAETNSAIQQAVVVQLVMGIVVVLATWLMADLPLGTSRGPDPEPAPGASAGLKQSALAQVPGA
jgi:EmrB/QacA subfamily drug resistance transporter